MSLISEAVSTEADMEPGDAARDMLIGKLGPKVMVVMVLRIDFEYMGWADYMMEMGAYSKQGVVPRLLLVMYWCFAGLVIV